jgi:hypothetical protein
MAIPLWLQVSVGGRRFQRLEPGAFNNTMIIWALSPTRYKSRVSLAGSSCTHGVLSIPHQEKHDTLIFGARRVLLTLQVNILVGFLSTRFVQMLLVVNLFNTG